jgi:hypothetical protein
MNDLISLALQLPHAKRRLCHAFISGVRLPAESHELFERLDGTSEKKTMSNEQDPFEGGSFGPAQSFRASE